MHPAKQYCIMSELLFIPSQLRYSLNMKRREEEIQMDERGRGKTILLAVISSDISLRSSISLCHPVSGFCTQ